MKPNYSKQTPRFNSVTYKFFMACILAASSGFGYSSDLTYSGPKLISDYAATTIVHNSQFIYPTADKLTFVTDEYLANNAPELLPLREAIDTWAAIKSIHPKVLSQLLKAYFKHRKVDSSWDNRQLVLQMAAGLQQHYLKNKNKPLAASLAVDAISQAFKFETDFTAEMAVERVLPQLYNRGVSPLYGYLQPPWPRGESWAGGGVHGGSIRNSLDFWSNYRSWGGDTSTFWVSAAQTGVARVWSSCSVTVIHPNGWETSYYHLDNVQVTDFDDVTDNQILSNYADNEPQALCQGGFSSGPHLHLSVRNDGNAVLIDEPNLDFSSWKHHAGEGNYDFDCETSYYTLIPDGSEVCPASRNLPNNTLATIDLIFSHDFEAP